MRRCNNMRTKRENWTFKKSLVFVQYYSHENSWHYSVRMRVSFDMSIKCFFHPYKIVSNQLRTLSRLKICRFNCTACLMLIKIEISLVCLHFINRKRNMFLARNLVLDQWNRSTNIFVWNFFLVYQTFAMVVYGYEKFQT